MLRAVLTVLNQAPDDFVRSNSGNQQGYSTHTSEYKTTLHRPTNNKISDSITTLSSNYSKLIVGTVAKTTLGLIVIDVTSAPLETIRVSEKLKDAILLPDGQIVCALEKHKVGIIAETGDVVAWSETLFTDIQYLSISPDDNVIYLASGRDGVFQSPDGGVSWSYLFQSHHGWRSIQAVRVTVKQREQFWVVEMLNNKWRLRVYSGSRFTTGENIDDHVDNETVKVDFKYSKLAYDGSKYIYVSDYSNHSVHVFSVDVLSHVISFLWSNGDVQHPTRLHIDRKRMILYVGQSCGIVKSLNINKYLK